MSTEYVCFDAGNESQVVSLYEHSGKFDLLLEDHGYHEELEDLSAEQVARMAIKMLKAVHYNDEEALLQVVKEERAAYEIGIRL